MCLSASAIDGASEACARAQGPQAKLPYRRMTRLAKARAAGLSNAIERCDGGRDTERGWYKSACKEKSRSLSGDRVSYITAADHIPIILEFDTYGCSESEYRARSLITHQCGTNQLSGVPTTNLDKAYARYSAHQTITCIVEI